MTHVTPIISPLRQRMLHDMRMRKLAPKTQSAYLRAVQRLAGFAFRWKDYRAKGRTRHKTMTLAAGEFMRRFLLHVLPSGFHRIRHYGLLANAGPREHLARARERLLGSTADAPAATDTDDPTAPPEPVTPTYVCPDCGAPMQILDTLVRIPHIRAPPPAPAAA